MINGKKIFLFILLLIFFIIPFSVRAAEENEEWLGLIPCGNTEQGPCTLCHFFVMFQNIMKWGLDIIFILAVLIIFIAGIVYIISSGNPGLMGKTKQMITLAISGIVIVLLAWIIINTTLYVLGATDIRGRWIEGNGWSGVWYEVNCPLPSTEDFR
jgi:hypothetical protein